MCPPRRNLPFVKAPFSELRVNSPCANSRLILLQSAEYQFQPPRLNARVSLSFDVSSSQAMKSKSIPLFLAGSKELRVSLPCADLTFATTIAAKMRKPPPRLHFSSFNNTSHSIYQSIHSILITYPSSLYFLLFKFSSLLKNVIGVVQIRTSERGSSSSSARIERMGPGHGVRNAVRNGIRRVRQLTYDDSITTNSTASS